MWPVLLASALAAPSLEISKGRLLVVGGGRIDDALRAKIVRLGGPRMVIVPFASDGSEPDEAYARLWRRAGASEVTTVLSSDPRAARAALARADFIWMPGGKQTILMRKLRELDLADVIRQRFREGAVVGGTSAGASIVSRWMIRSYSGKTDLLDGLGLWPGVIVDQHFLKRQRLGRLSSMVLGRPDLVGVGIDESTAILVSGRQFEVFGASDVIVLDARKAARQPGQKPAPEDVVKHTLRPGSRYHLDRGLVTN
jgi:cyanophycinase